ncbi:MAG TPA: hypothetical protein VGD37_15130 [Kofleriaceae bacterium]
MATATAARARTMARIRNKTDLLTEVVIGAPAIAWPENHSQYALPVAASGMHATR